MTRGLWSRTQILQIWALRLLNAICILRWGTTRGVNGDMQSCQEWGVKRQTIPQGMAMTKETQSDCYSLKKGPGAAMFAKIVSASMHLPVLHFVTTSCLGEMGYCDKHCLTPVVSNSSGYSCPVSSCRGTSLGVFLPWLVRDLPLSPLSSPALPPHHLYDLNLGLWDVKIPPMLV